MKPARRKGAGVVTQSLVHNKCNKNYNSLKRTLI